MEAEQHAHHLSLQPVHIRTDALDILDDLSSITGVLEVADVNADVILFVVTRAELEPRLAYQARDDSRVLLALQFDVAPSFDL
jgi:hypothetical protein